MEDSKLIASLIPVDDLTKHVFNYDQNKKRLVPPNAAFNDDPVISSREATPAYIVSQTNDDGEKYENKIRLVLNFGRPPKDPSKGYAFGTDEQKSDVVFGSRGARGTSGIHFHISFDVINNQKRLVLRDSSTNGTAVSL